MSDQKPVIIAHRGASGYLPEHTLPAKALAYAMGADYLEQDVVATRDDELLVMHDIHVDRVTNVADVFPGRARDDGRFYVRDFDLAELRRLSVWERMNPDGTAVYPERFPARSGSFRVHTLGAEIELIRGLNASTGRVAGIYPEIKRPAWHKEQGVDIAPIMLELLTREGYTTRDDPVFLQCFDAAEVRRLREELKTDLKLIQLIGDNSWKESTTDYHALRTDAGLDEIARVADGIGPWLEQLYVVDDGRPRSTGLVERAHARGLAVHPYTFRMDSLPEGFASFDGLVGFVIGELGADGLFTDFPDLARRALPA
ncbi:MAG: glycerophosphodiester phosphodiesterase [Woeseiaceae bacterium]|nr:glycerophosphodiester phosphodiesterase [Woeseiaceae bacterium]